MYLPVIGIRIIFQPYWPSVEVDSTALSVVPCPTSSQTLQRSPLYQVQCRARLDSALRCTSPMSSQTEQRSPLYQIQCRVRLDSAFRCTRSSVESESTALSVVSGPVSSHNRQRSPLYQVQCQVKLDMLLHKGL